MEKDVLEEEQIINCPNCHSTDVQKDELVIYEPAMGENVIPFIALSALGIAGIAAGLVKSAINDFDKSEYDYDKKTRYRCKNCGKLFEI